MIPNWQWHNTGDRVTRELLDDYRSDHPILWALCVGHRTARAIANALAMPYDIVLYELRQYKNRDGLIEDAESARAVVWGIIDDDLAELRAFARAQIKTNNKAVSDDNAG